MNVVVRWARVDAVGPDVGVGVGLGVDGAFDWLSPGERARLVAMRQTTDRWHFLGARLLLRQTLVNEFDCQPDDLGLTQTCARCGGAHGRPIITVAGRTGPHVSFAHAGGVVMVAIAGQPVGVDLEPRNGADDIRDWVRTEAVLKATGDGLNIDPRLVTISSSETPRLSFWPGPGPTPTLRLADVDMGAEYSNFAACVARLGRRRVRLDARATPLALPA